MKIRKARKEHLGEFGDHIVLREHYFHQFSNRLTAVGRQPRTYVRRSSQVIEPTLTVETFVARIVLAIRFRATFDVGRIAVDTPDTIRPSDFAQSLDAKKLYCLFTDSLS